MPRLYVVAGPNGCGKSTLTRTSHFSNTVIIDPDAIVRSMGAPVCKHSHERLWTGDVLRSNPAKPT